jgi:predicted nucleic acid-binding protein
MPAVLIDSNVLLDVLTVDERWISWSATVIEETSDRFQLVINPVVYAEISTGFQRIEDLDASPPVDREGLCREKRGRVGNGFAVYRRRGGTRRSPLPDFFIGAHAAVAG